MEIILASASMKILSALAFAVTLCATLYLLLWVATANARHAREEEEEQMRRKYGDWWGR